MSMFEQIEKEKQKIRHDEKLIALERLKKRRADTRHKIELGGLVIKSKIVTYKKSIILGALIYSLQLIQRDSQYLMFFEKIGNSPLKKTNVNNI